MSSLFGSMYSFTNAVVVFNGVPLFTFTGLEYDNNRPFNPVLGAQGEIVGKTTGSSAPTASITMSKDEWKNVLASSPNGKKSGLQDFDIVVTFQNDNPTTDVIKVGGINGAPTSIQEGDGSISVTLELMVYRIEENVG